MKNLKTVEVKKNGRAEIVNLVGAEDVKLRPKDADNIDYHLRDDNDDIKHAKEELKEKRKPKLKVSDYVIYAVLFGALAFSVIMLLNTT